MLNIRRKIETASQIWQNNGWQGIKFRLKNLAFTKKQDRIYQKWTKEFDTLTDTDRQLICGQIENFQHQPLISIILPVYNTEEKWLRLCLDSVCRQNYQNWELCIADDCSPKPHIRRILEEYQNKDSRIKITFRQENGHISAASNSALEMANGEFTVLLDHDDELAEFALYFVAAELNRFPETQMIYSDEDLIDENGKRSSPKFKPDWSLDFMYSLNLTTHLSAFRTALLKKIGGFKIGMEGSQDYDLALRVIEQIDENQIRHIPKILYHWRTIRGSVALDLDSKTYAHERARDAIRQHFQRTGVNAKVEPTLKYLHQVIYDIEPSFEIIQTQNATAEKLNSFANNSLSEALIFVDPSIKIENQENFATLAKFAMQKGIGAVGGKILDESGIIHNAGIILGVQNTIGFAHRGFSKIDSGNLVRAQTINNFSAVASVIAIRRELFVELNGFDSENFNHSFFEIDLCLRLREKGLRIVFYPYTEFVQTGISVVEEGLQNVDSDEFVRFKERWKHQLARDRFYNDNLSLNDARFEIAFPPRIEKNWKY